MTVYLVGAGPGDPGLITVRGAEVLRRAEVVVHDRLVSPQLLELIPAEAERIDVGKEPGTPVDQEAVNQLLVDRGRTGATVVRLKGGDPFVFGRGGEEAAALVAAGVAFEIVPGVTSALGVPAYAGIPVTQRGLTGAFTVVTGHSRHGTSSDAVDWDALARVGGTIVVLMGAAQRASIANRLIGAGLDPATPVAAVRWGTRPDQCTVRTTLRGLEQVSLEPPVTLVIGAVAGVQISWFESRPMFGRRVVLTRPRGRNDQTAARLREAGAHVVEVPLVRPTEPADGGEALRKAARELSRFTWVAFTSATAVELFFSEVRDARSLGPVSVAAVGPGTARALAARGVRPDLVADPAKAAGGAGLAADFPEAPPGGAVLFPRAEDADPVLSDSLRTRGWEVCEVTAYRTVTADVPPGVLAEMTAADALVLASGSAARALVELAGAPDSGEASVRARIVCIGPTTAGVARQLGLDVAEVATAPTPAAVSDAVVRALGSAR